MSANLNYLKQIWIKPYIDYNKIIYKNQLKYEMQVIYL